MTVVLVHGVPDTHRVWRPLLEHVARRDIVALSLPGFACPVAPEFAATKEAYVEWLLDALEKLPGPLDAVGHDWGFLLLIRALAVRPELFRSWAGGGVPVSAAYEWHQTARIWQTPGAGERLMALLDAPLGARMLVKAGMPDAIAAETASLIDPPMRDCILKLYRSGIDVGRAWEPALAGIDRPGLVLWGEKDIYAPARFADDLGRVTSAEVVRFEGCGHWWQCEVPARTAAELERFWGRLADR